MRRVERGVGGKDLNTTSHVRSKQGSSRGNGQQIMFQIMDV